MKPTAAVTAIALLAAVFSVAASAQTGRPSDVETQDPPQAGHVVDVTRSQVGSYARYLMLQGVTRDEAISQAQTFDHPATATRFASSAARAKASASAQQ